MSRLVEARKLADPPVLDRSVRFFINPEHIDEYDHVNHANYIKIFEEVRNRYGTDNGMRVSALSITYREQFKAGEIPVVKTQLFRVPDDTKIVYQRMVKEPGRYDVRQTTKLVPEETTHNPSVLDYSPEGKPIMVDQSIKMVLEGQGALSHTVYAPVFESERIRAIKNTGLDVKTLVHEHNTLIMVVQLDAAYDATLQAGKEIEVKSHAHLDMPKRGEFFSMVCLQTARETGSITGVTQLTKYMFVDSSGERKPLPDKIKDKFTSSIRNV